MRNAAKGELVPYIEGRSSNESFKKVILEISIGKQSFNRGEITAYYSFRELIEIIKMTSVVEYGPTGQSKVLSFQLQGDPGFIYWLIPSIPGASVTNVHQDSNRDLIVSPEMGMKVLRTDDSFRNARWVELIDERLQLRVANATLIPFNQVPYMVTTHVYPNGQGMVGPIYGVSLSDGVSQPVSDSEQLIISWPLDRATPGVVNYGEKVIDEKHEYSANSQEYDVLVSETFVLLQKRIEDTLGFLLPPGLFTRKEPQVIPGLKGVKGEVVFLMVTDKITGYSHIIEVIDGVMYYKMQKVGKEKDEISLRVGVLRDIMSQEYYKPQILQRVFNPLPDESIVRIQQANIDYGAGTSEKIAEVTIGELEAEHIATALEMIKTRVLHMLNDDAIPQEANGIEIIMRNPLGNILRLIVTIEENGDLKWGSATAFTKDGKMVKAIQEDFMGSATRQQDGKIEVFARYVGSLSNSQQ